MKNKQLLLTTFFALIISVTCYLYLNACPTVQDKSKAFLDTSTMDLELDETESKGFSEVEVFLWVAASIKHLATMKGSQAGS